MRNILYPTGTRADFGLMRHTLERIHQCPNLKLSVLVTGAHLDPRYGETVKEIEAAGLPIGARIPVGLDTDDGATMARAIATELEGIVAALEQERPDLVLLLGDRGEMLAAALAAMHLNIPIAHIHGGERSGTVDEPIRHAISKLAHYHFAATEGARERLIRMGEAVDRIFVTGAPGIDGIETLATASREDLCRENGLRSDQPVALVVFHPVVQRAEEMSAQASDLMRSVIDDCGLQGVVLLPNSDAGRDPIRAVLERFESQRCRLFVHMPRPQFVSWMRAADVMVGNSSSGIIEAASLGLPVVNVGDRQIGRERSENVIDSPVDRGQIGAAIKLVLTGGRGQFNNVYGRGATAERIVELLEGLPLDRELLMKTNAY